MTTAGRAAGTAAVDPPRVPDEVTGAELDPEVRAQLAALPTGIAIQVARELVMVGLLLDEEPAAALGFALAARGRAGRVAVVREACGEAAYAAGRYELALREWRTAWRMTRSPDYLPMMADCERAIGRPDRALELSRLPAVGALDVSGRVEMTIVAAGARRDTGDVAAALALLESAPLHSTAAAPWLLRLRYAYADTLLVAGRSAEALSWFRTVAAADYEEGVTDAVDRVRALASPEVSGST